MASSWHSIAGEIEVKTSTQLVKQVEGCFLQYGLVDVVPRAVVTMGTDIVDVHDTAIIKEDQIRGNPANNFIHGPLQYSQ